MRYLNKICFINSAAVRYAELELNGNVHFIGTQGVGKSTLLRAILFFYNANALKLGVPSGPTNKSFAEWYFPYQNSWIVYEVQRETGGYCILAFKAQNRICYYFVDAPYDRTLLLDSNGKAFAAWDKVRAQLDARNIFYSRRIKSFEEYRDILYGNLQGKKEFHRYALLESRQYLNIPRTIQNVFLNSKLDAEFIKQTIIDSMSEDDLQIDLQNYTHHLKNFEMQLADIRQFRRPSVQRQADKTAQLYVAIKHRQRESQQFASALAAALNLAAKKQPALLELLASDQEISAAVEAKIAKQASVYQRQQDKLTAAISILDDKLKTAKKKAAEYQNRNIQELIIRVAGRSSLEQERRDLLAEKNLLAGQFQELVQKFTALLTALENQELSFCNRKEQEKLAVKEDFYRQRDQVSQEYAQLLEAIRQQHKAAMDDARQAYEGLQRQASRLSNQVVTARHKPLYAKEIEQQRNHLQGLEHQLQTAQNQKEANVTRIAALKREQELEENALRKSNQREVEQVQQRLQQLQEQLQSTDLKLESSRDSFYGWLNRHRPGWEKSIGKVCDEELLFDDSLAPQLTGAAAESFYGVTLDLTQRDKNVKSLADYQHQQALLKQALAAEQFALQGLATTLAEALQKLQQRLHPKAREVKESNRELDYLIGQYPQKREATQLSLNRLLSQAREETEAELQRLESERAALAEKELGAREQLASLEGQLNRHLKSKQRQRGQKLTELEQSRDRLLATLDSAMAEKQRQYRQRKAEIETQKSRELTNKGVDTDRLSTIDKELTRIDLELEFVEKHRDYVAEYQRDKRELFDHLKDFKNQQQLKVREQAQKRSQFAQQNRLQQQELVTLNAKIEQHRYALEQLKLDFEAFEMFKKSEVFPSVEKQLSNPQQFPEENKGCRQLMEAIKDSYYAIFKRQGELKETVDKFLGHFSVENLFKFETRLTSTTSYLDFSQELTEFIEEDKIGEFETRLNERFADIVSRIGKETTGMTSRTGDIQKVISKINRDFTEKNFVGAIGKIELKLDESANSVFVALRQIKEFNDLHVLDFGSRDLFSTESHSHNNKKAVDLLTVLTKEIGNANSSSISLSDSFELKFRIEENQNDTGWVEKLSNVGSDGTDVLVKAMVNIMLLNVFKEGASRRFKDFRLHCMMDEIGKLHPSNVRGILRFANDRNIMLINGSPTENNALSYKHIFKIAKDEQRMTRVTRILTNHGAP